MRGDLLADFDDELISNGMRGSEIRLIELVPVRLDHREGWRC